MKTKICAIACNLRDFNEYFEDRPELNKEDYILVNSIYYYNQCLKDNIVFSDIISIYDVNIRSGYNMILELCKTNLQ